MSSPRCPVPCSPGQLCSSVTESRGKWEQLGTVDSQAGAEVRARGARAALTVVTHRAVLGQVLLGLSVARLPPAQGPIEGGTPSRGEPHCCALWVSNREGTASSYTFSLG